ncbi:Chromatin segregation and condensation protein Rec8/ScpA/Scc1, kleisin family [Borreliella japonica]|uniref:Chromatin segregation and condensation protein Rec8/ScpA/Scc1, kleisin family n=1 Tax=Borreliella japonica TaxID=34095 RepID=A0A1G4PTN5_BORJA|nr:hypothetical protein [Borreliella japonica]WKC88759.1 hypothetical protein QIA20_01265 [Borreliella japonica]SCW35468.1 Chromatin segregation and condensation protein Rec8/ScpA/Scc1, kleisin family [Borreliella japonica]
MSELSSYSINLDNFTGGIELFFEYVNVNRRVLRTLRLNQIIEEFIVASNDLNISIRGLIDFFYLANNLFYWKTQILFPFKLEYKDKAERKVVERLIGYNKNRENENLQLNQIKNFKLYDSKMIEDFIFGDSGNFVKNSSVIANDNNKKKNLKKKSSELKEKVVNKSFLRNKKLKVACNKYELKIFEKKMKIISILNKENSIIFDSLLDFNADNYSFERFSYFLVSLECKMLNIINLGYLNNKLVLYRGCKINDCT